MPGISAQPIPSERDILPRTGFVCPELLAPAGDWECARAAVENGADAIYFGLERFNARMRAQNFAEADLPKLMEFLHRRGVKGYVTFNTLVFSNELRDAEQYLRAIIAAGVDAAIVQDVGICRLIRKLSPDFPIHASTQMTITSVAGVEFARELGCNLVVLARECSLKEIEKIQESSLGAPASRRQGFDHRMAGGTPALPGADKPAALPLEVFVHGALCVAYSGQCLTSEALGGRSANRGECAQACRMPYDLISDGKVVPLGDRRYLLSPQDLAGMEVLPDLVRSGVASLKIEGRLKSPEYVANITRAYRQALDRAVRELNAGAQSDARHLKTENQYNLEMAFSRGLYTGWFNGINNQELVHARFGKKRGVFLGEVLRVQGERVIIKLQAPLKPGDGVVFDSGHPDQPEQGGRVYSVDVRKGHASLGFGRGDVHFDCIHVGDKLWKTSDPELDKRLRQSFSGDAPKFQRPIDLEVHGCIGKPLTIIARDEQGDVVRLDSAMPLARAEKQPLTTQKLEEQLGRLGGTPFRLGTLENHLESSVILPLSELNRLRRELVAQLESLRARPKRWTLVAQTSSPAGSPRVPPGLQAGGETPPQPAAGTDALHVQEEAELTVLIRNLSQLPAAIDSGVGRLYCEFEDPKKYREAVTQFRAKSTGEIWVAPPRIFKSGEEWILKQVRSSEADGYLVRNYDHLNFFSDCRKIGDFSLNVANELTAEYFVKHFDLERVTASYDLNISQLEALLHAAHPEWFEITIHQHMPMFHMEHCVFCAFLSSGKDYRDCGRPCDHHEVKIRDRVGAEHVLKADAGCRNTVFNALAQTGAEYVNRLLALGARRFRIEFVNETPDQVRTVIARYRRLLAGEISGPDLWRELKLLNQLGVTRGQLAG